MKLVMVALTALSLGACHVEGPGAGEAKFTPEKPMGESGEIETESGATLTYVLAEADKEGYPDQHFVFFIFWGSSAGMGKWEVAIRATNENLNPLPGQNDCVDRFTKNSPRFNTDSLTIPKGRKKVKIEWSSDKLPRTTTALEYTVIGSDNEPVTYKFKNQNATPENVPTIGKITDADYRELMGGDDCDHVSQSGEEDS